MDNKNVPAFPIVMQPGTPYQESCPGMTKRELAFFITLGAYLGKPEATISSTEKHMLNILSLVDFGFEVLDKQPAPDK